MERYTIPTCEEGLDNVIGYERTLEAIYGYEYLCLWFLGREATVTVELLESLPIEMVVYKSLKSLEDILLGRIPQDATLRMPIELWQKYTVVCSNAMILTD